jgi:hypothetical protein
MTWIDNIIEQASEPIIVVVNHLELGIDEIKVLPLSVKEYNGLKQNPELKGLSEEDRAERLGMLMVFEMMMKCDKTLTWESFQRLPLTVIGQLTTSIMEAVNGPLE